MKRLLLVTMIAAGALAVAPVADAHMLAFSRAHDASVRKAGELCRSADRHQGVDCVRWGAEDCRRVSEHRVDCRAWQWIRFPEIDRKQTCREKVINKIKNGSPTLHTRFDRTVPIRCVRGFQ
jgi:hypothetical protein